MKARSLFFFCMICITFITHALVFSDRGLLHQEEMRRDMKKIDRQISQLSLENERFSVFLDQAKENPSSTKKAGSSIQYRNAILLRFSGEHETAPQTDLDFFQRMLNELNDARQEGSVLFFVFMLLLTLTISTIWNYQTKQKELTRKFHRSI